MTALLLSNLRKNIVKKSIWKCIDIFPNQILNFLNIFIEHGKIIADYTKNIERISQLLCMNVIIESLYKPYAYGIAKQLCLCSVGIHKGNFKIEICIGLMWVLCFFCPPGNFYCWPSQGGSSVLVLW